MTTKDGFMGTVDFGSVSVSPASSVWSLGVTIDDKELVDNVCKSCNFHIRTLRHICHHISEDTAKTIDWRSSVYDLITETLCCIARRLRTLFACSRCKALLPVSFQGDGCLTKSHYFLLICSCRSPLHHSFLLHVDRVKSACEERAFRHSASVIWNSLPQHIQ